VSDTATWQHVMGEDQIGREARMQHDDHIDTRLWLRLFSCSMQIEQNVRQRLRQRFDMTLSRFDFLAQLDRYPEGLRMNMLSRYLMVTGGNVTGLTDQLVKEKLVERIQDPQDRRSYLVRLTDKGRKLFRRMAKEHEQWLGHLFEGLDKPSKDALYTQLGQLRMHLVQRQNMVQPQEQNTSTTRKRAP